MKELITFEQANKLMYIVLLAAPVIGLIWGVATKRVKHGFIAGVLIGLANLAMWTVYNNITDKLGLDTVKNLLVNLALFIAVGLIAGMVWGWAIKPKNV